MEKIEKLNNMLANHQHRQHQPKTMPDSFEDLINDCIKQTVKDLANELALNFGGDEDEYLVVISNLLFSDDDSTPLPPLSLSPVKSQTKTTTTTTTPVKQDKKATAYYEFCKQTRPGIVTAINLDYPDETKSERATRVRKELSMQWKKLSDTEKNDYNIIANHLNENRMAVAKARSKTDPVPDIIISTIDIISPKETKKQAGSNVTPNVSTITATLVGKHWTIKNTNLVVNNTRQKSVLGVLDNNCNVSQLNIGHLDLIKKLGLRINATAVIDPEACKKITAESIVNK